MTASSIRRRSAAWTKETSICIMDDTGRIVREVKVASEPEALLQVLGIPIYRFKRIGLEAGPLSQWLFSALAEAELPVVCVETRHMHHNVLAIALANKLARIAWAVLAKGRAFELTRTNGAGVVRPA
jgi:hypothetical protein